MGIHSLIEVIATKPAQAQDSLWIEPEHDRGHAEHDLSYSPEICELPGLLFLLLNPVKRLCPTGPIPCNAPAHTPDSA